MYTTGIGRTDVGLVRHRNEDVFHVDDALGLYLVCDGMGGHGAGDVAAAAAAAGFSRRVEEQRRAVDRVRAGDAGPETLASLAVSATLGACSDVYRLAQTRAGCQGMGCTLTAVLVAGSKAVLAHVGDSRLYLVRDGIPHQLTTDHTLGAVLRRSRFFRKEAVNPKRFEHVLTRAVGTQESVEVDSLVFDVMPGDRLLLCSDGLTDHVGDPLVLADQLGADDLDVIPDELIRLANAAGGRDNVTAVLVHVDAEEARRPIEVRLATDVHVRLGTLRSVFLFEDLSLAHTVRVLNGCRLLTLSRGETLLPFGGCDSSVVIVVEGRIAVVRPGVDKRHLLAGDHWGETALLHPRPSDHALVAATDSRVLVLDRDGFLALARSRPHLGVALLERLGGRLSRLAARQGSEEGGRVRQAA